MKKIILIFTILLIIYACKKDKSKKAEDNSVHIQTVNPVINKLYEKGKWYGIYINTTNNTDTLFLYNSYTIVDGNDTNIVANLTGNGDYGDNQYVIYTRHLKEHFGPYWSTNDNITNISNNINLRYYKCGDEFKISNMQNTNGSSLNMGNIRCTSANSYGTDVPITYKLNVNDSTINLKFAFNPCPTIYNGVLQYNFKKK